MGSDNRRIGNMGEEKARHFLEGQGYEILERNWRYGHLELDLICRRDGQIIFVEVKTRRSLKFGMPALAVNRAKQRKLITAAKAWLVRHACWECPCRFDVIAVTGTADDFYMEHFPNAFDISQTLGCSNSDRQYW